MPKGIYQRKTLPIVERFWARVDRSGGPDACWPWTGYVEPLGYGRFCLNRSVWQGAHRAAYELFVGAIPDGLFIDHTCHNRDKHCPGGYDCLHRRCVNPRHLEPVSNAVNRQRGRNGNTSSSNGQWKGLVNQGKTHCIYGHEFTPENTRITPQGWRVCRECRRVWNREALGRRRSAVANPRASTTSAKAGR